MFAVEMATCLAPFDRVAIEVEGDEGDVVHGGLKERSLHLRATDLHQAQDHGGEDELHGQVHLAAGHHDGVGA